MSVCTGLLKEFTGPNGLDYQKTDASGKILLTKFILSFKLYNINLLYQIISKTGALHYSKRDNDNKCTLDYAVENQWWDICAYIFDHGDYNPEYLYKGEPLLWHLIKSNASADMFIIRMIRSGKGNVGFSLPDGSTALMYACTHRLENVALELIKTGQSNPSFVDESGTGTTALEYTCCLEDDKDDTFNMNNVIDALIATNDCNINHIDDDGGSALVFAYDTEKESEDRIFRATTNPYILVKYISRHRAIRDDFFKIISEMSAIQAMLTGENSFFKKHTCGICFKICRKEYSHTCGARFCVSCIQTHICHVPGELVSINKLTCPGCIQKLSDEECLKILGDTVLDETVYISEERISKLDSSKKYRICAECKDFLEDKVIDTTCSAIEIDKPEVTVQTKCSTCLNKIFVCPKCGIKLEHIDKCNDFACCFYGYDNCLNNPTCDHGKSKGIPCCGNRWKISHQFMNSSLPPLTREPCIRRRLSSEELSSSSDEDSSY